jgi:beta-phosphoglucomutase-like phosphatase (HAD superfamily)
VLEATRRLGVNPAECVVVGDSPFDVQAGRRAGSFTIAVLSATYTRKQLKNAEPTLIIKEFERVLDVL